MPEASLPPKPATPWDPAPYRIKDAREFLTPALAIYPEAVEANIAATLRLLGGDPDRWRPHVKTSKLALVVRKLVESGVRACKCATSLELRTALECGAEDVLVAYPSMGANARRMREIAASFPDRGVSVLVEHAEQLAAWTGSEFGIFIDLNPGMDRTGIGAERRGEIIDLTRRILALGLTFRGLHQYEGHLGALPLEERTAAAHQGYDRLMEAVLALDQAGLAVSEVVTSGTPAFPCAMAYAPFRTPPFIHRVSPGTVVYNDCSSLAQLPAEFGYRPAALVLARVVSRPAAGRITCDAGHKAISADAGAPTCAVLGWPALRPLKPSEEHLPIEVPAGEAAPGLGELVYLLPKHVCPTVNNFDQALLVAAGRITGVERVTARGREGPCLDLMR